jgi:hypothetical protein
MKRIIKSETFVVFVLICIIVLLNASVWIVKSAKTPAGREFIPIHNSLSDYPFYTSVIRQGIDRQVQVFDRFAVEPHEGSVVHFFYLVLGWIGGIFGITSAHVIYHVARFILGVGWCMVIYWLCDVMIREKWVRILAFFFSLYSASFPRFLFVDGGVTTSWFMTWWSELDPIIRAAFVPHFTLGHIAMVVALIAIFHYERSGDRKWLYRGAVSAWVGAFVHPPSFIQVAMVVPLYVLLVRRKHWVLGALSILVAGGLGLMYINQASDVFPWNQPKQFEGVNFAVPIFEYLLALGPIVLLGLVGALVKRKAESTWLLVIWIVTSLVMIPVSKMMPFSPWTFIREHPISNIRFLQVAIWVPLGILSAHAVVYLWQQYGKRIAIATLVVFMLLTFVGYPASINGQVNHMYFSAEYTYPKVGYIQAVKALGSVVKPGQVTLSLSLGGVTTPMYINRTTYVGQVVYTPDREAKMKKSWAFYHGDMHVCEAFAFVKENRVGAVLYSFDEQHAGQAVKFYSFLQPWNTYGETTIYSVVDSKPPGC